MNPRNAPSACQAGAPPHGGTERVLAVLKELARHPEGATLDELSRAVAIPKSSVHRALSALVQAGLAVHPAVGLYGLGTEFVHLAYAHHEQRQEPRLVQPCLNELAVALGETAHYAELEGHDVVYRAKVNPPDQNVQMTSTIGGRNPAFCTGVGKAMLAHRLAQAQDARAFIAALGPLTRRTAGTLTSASALITDLRATARRGYALDDEESELGVVCIAFPLFRASPNAASGAISVAALRHRMSLETLESHASGIRQVIHRHLGEVTGTSAAAQSS